jgi:hypothetical protein
MKTIHPAKLAGQLWYAVLDESKQEDAAHELHNLDRIMTHLMRRESRDATSRRQYERLLEAVKAARKPGRATGLQVSEAQLAAWEKEIGQFVGSATV